MRIVSKFRDYYDGACGVGGFDSSIVYVRHTNEVKVSNEDRRGLMSPITTSSKHYFYYDDKQSNIGYRRIDIGNHFLGFCGKYYHLLSYPTTIFRQGEGTSKVNVYFNSWKKLRDFIKKEKGKEVTKEFEEYYSERRNHWVGGKTWKNTSMEDLTKEEYNRAVRDTGAEPFFFLKAPIFIYPNENNQATVNPRLDKIGFQSIVDPYQAFQEVSMFVGGVLSNQEQPQQVTDDKVLRDSKGFDEKSFKNMSPGRKENRKLNKLRKRQQKGR